MKKRWFTWILALLTLLCCACGETSPSGWYLEPEKDGYGEETGFQAVVCDFSGKNSERQKFTGKIAFHADVWTVAIADGEGMPVRFDGETAGRYTVSLKIGDRSAKQAGDEGISYLDTVCFDVNAPGLSEMLPALIRGEKVTVNLTGTDAPEYSFTLPGEGFVAKWQERAVSLYEKQAYEKAAAEFAALEGYGSPDAAQMRQKCEEALRDAAYEEANALFGAGEYKAAKEAFAALGEHKDSADMIPECDYRIAAALLEEGEYEQARAIFVSLGEYKDSADKISECDYLAAVVLLEAGKYEEAKAAFAALGEYKDSEDMILECDYRKACALSAEGDYEAACAIFRTLTGYKDADELLAEYEALLAEAAADAEKAAEREAVWTVGNYVTFGTYPQTKAGDDQTPIEWLILKREGDKALIISRFALDSQQYHNEYTDVTWENCTLRKWLNEDFMNKAFTAAEQEAIQMTPVDNSRDQGYISNDTLGGNDTWDKVFLLSHTEAWEYFSTAQERACAPTDYAVKQGAWTSDRDKADKRRAGSWWLRSPGKKQDEVTLVESNGERENFYDDGEGLCVRPALWVDILLIDLPVPRQEAR